MRRHPALAALLLLAAVPLLAQDYEQVMLPISPSVVMCGYHSRYDTRLLVFNDSDRMLDRVCTDDAACRPIAAKAGLEIAGPDAGGLPLPSFVYVPKGLRMSLLVESSDLRKPDERAYTEVPVVRASDFRSGKMQFIVRMDPGFRQTVRIFGLDGHAYAQLMMRVYSLDGAELLHSCIHELWPSGAWANAEGLQASPSFGMECDMSDHVPANGQQVRIELEPMTEGKYWAFLSITNNKTQNFYTVLP